MLKASGSPSMSRERVGCNLLPDCAFRPDEVADGVGGTILDPSRRKRHADGDGMTALARIAWATE